MALIKCKECGHEVSTQAVSCPNCGTVIKKKTGCLTYLGAGFALIVGLGVIGSLIPNTNTTKPETGVTIPSVGEQFVTFEKYQKIENGMTYEQVKQIIGHEGEELSQNEIAGIKTIMYQWVNKNGSNMNAMFQNDAVVQKSQFGLK
jgi:hypothetical protein